MLKDYLHINLKVCITELSMNGKTILTGKNGDRQEFWIDAGGYHCDDTWTTAPEITIQNGVVTTDICGK